MEKPKENNSPDRKMRVFNFFFGKGWKRALISIIPLFVLNIIFLIVYDIVVRVLPIENYVTSVTSEGSHQQISLFLFVLTTAVAAYVTVYLFRKFVDKKSLLSLGFCKKSLLKDLLWGALMVVLVYAIAVDFFYLTGYLQGEFVSSFSLLDLVLSIGIFALVSFGEELYVRGYFLTNLSDSFSRPLALVISAVFFAILHSFNASLNYLSFLNLILAGILLGITYIYTKNLWLPFSLHFFWNFIQGPILGFNVSGTDVKILLFRQDIKPGIITGGKFGFEGSILCTLLLIIAIVLFALFYENRLRKKRAS